MLARVHTHTHTHTHTHNLNQFRLRKTWYKTDQGCWCLLNCYMMGHVLTVLMILVLTFCIDMTIWVLLILKIYNRMTTSILKQDPNTKRFKWTLIYFDMDTQYAHFQGSCFQSCVNQTLASFFFFFSLFLSFWTCISPRYILALMSSYCLGGDFCLW